MMDISHDSLPEIETSMVGNHRLRVLFDTITDILACRVNLQVLDIGCGEGAFLEYVQEKYPNNSYCGIDNSSKGILAAKTKYPKMKFEVGDCNAKLPYKSNQFDLIIAGELIEHLHDTDNFFLETKRILKPGGSLFLTTPNLSSWIDRGMLMLGYLPLSIEVSREGRSFGRRVFYRESIPSVGHIRCFTWRALADLSEYYGFSIKTHRGGWVHDFFLNKLITILFPSLAQIQIISLNAPEEKCRFCGSTLQSEHCQSCGCLTLSRGQPDNDVNATFFAYSYNKYEKNVLLKKIYLTWASFNAYLLSKNTILSNILNSLLQPLIGGKPNVDFSKREKFFDIGCGRGSFMRHLPDNWDVHGCDIVDYSKDCENMLVGNFENLGLEEDYTIVRAQHSLEHSIHPKKFLNKMVCTVKTGGLLIISSPNPNSYSCRIFKRHWLPLHVGSHFCILSMPAIKHYLSTHDCRILYARTYTQFSSAGSMIDLLHIKKHTLFFFMLFAVLLLPLTVFEYFVDKADSFVIYAKKCNIST